MAIPSSISDRSKESDLPNPVNCKHSSHHIANYRETSQMFESIQSTTIVKHKFQIRHISSVLKFCQRSCQFSGNESGNVDPAQIKTEMLMGIAANNNVQTESKLTQLHIGIGEASMIVWEHYICAPEGQQADTFVASPAVSLSSRPAKTFLYIDPIQFMTETRWAIQAIKQPVAGLQFK